MNENVFRRVEKARSFLKCCNNKKSHIDWAYTAPLGFTQENYKKCTIERIMIADGVRPDHTSRIVRNVECKTKKESEETAQKLMVTSV